jgi:hypothetical protein
VSFFSFLDGKQSGLLYYLAANSTTSQLDQNKLVDSSGNNCEGKITGGAKARWTFLQAKNTDPKRFNSLLAMGFPMEHIDLAIDALNAKQGTCVCFPSFAAPSRLILA